VPEILSVARHLAEVEPAGEEPPGVRIVGAVCRSVPSRAVSKDAHEWSPGQRPG
jgi:hypothetical protein